MGMRGRHILTKQNWRSKVDGEPKNLEWNWVTFCFWLVPEHVVVRNSQHPTGRSSKAETIKFKSITNTQNCPCLRLHEFKTNKAQPNRLLQMLLHIKRVQDLVPVFFILFYHFLHVVVSSNNLQNKNINITNN